MNYVNAFIAVAGDCKAAAGTVPTARGGKKTVALLEYEQISARPYAFTQEEVQFAVHVRRLGLSAGEAEARRAALWGEFFSRPVPCMRTSPLPRTYGWGLHFNHEGKVALVGVGTEEYERLSNDPTLRQTAAMRGKRR